MGTVANAIHPEGIDPVETVSAFIETISQAAKGSTEGSVNMAGAEWAKRWLDSIDALRDFGVFSRECGDS